MVGKGKACAECTQKCLLLHGKKKDPSATVTSFFKVMMGDRFSEFLFVPPKLTSTLFAMVDQETSLEDSSGHRWTVKLVILNGLLAFHEGWATFASEHGLQVGDFLVFSYIIGSHFVVKIYSTSGCEKLNLYEKNDISRGKRASTKLSPGKLPSDGRNSIAKIGNMHEYSSKVPSDSNIEIMNKNGEKEQIGTMNNSHYDNICEKSQPVSIHDFAEEPFYMINRDSRFEQGEIRSSLLDLSKLEKFEKKSRVDQTKKVQVSDKEESSHADKSSRYLIAPEAGRVNQDAFADERTSRMDPLDTLESGITKQRCNTEDKHKVPFTTEKNPYYGNTFRNRQTACKVDLGEYEKVDPETPEGAYRMVIPQMEHTPLTENNESALCVISGISTVAGQNHQSVKESKVIKAEHGEIFNQGLNDDKKVFGVVKSESVESFGLLSHNSMSFSCSIPVVSQSWLEIPKDWSSDTGAGRVKMERKILLLRDPAKRLWPVLYHERLPFRVLASGWEAFAKANNIMPGDICNFENENENEGSYRVHVIRRSSKQSPSLDILGPTASTSG